MNSLYGIVKTGQECLEKIRHKEKYQLIIMDEELPKLSSVHTLAKIKINRRFSYSGCINDKEERH